MLDEQDKVEWVIVGKTAAEKKAKLEKDEQKGKKQRR